MTTIISGTSGFVGKNLVSYFKNFKINILKLTRENLNINNFFEYGKLDAIIHLAGKAHDLKNISNPKEYYQVNTEITKELFDAFLLSDIKVFITISSVKAVADHIDFKLTEEVIPSPVTHYGKSKMLAEQYILSKDIPEGKRVYILRPCMIHGPGNKGNLTLLYHIVSKGFPWPLGKFVNSRSYLSVENLCFILKELIERVDIPSGVYNVADDVPLSTNEVIRLIAESKGKEARIVNLNKSLIVFLAKIGNILKLPLNTERLDKLTESYEVSNTKLKNALGKNLPVSSKEGLKKTFQSFSYNA